MRHLVFGLAVALFFGSLAQAHPNGLADLRDWGRDLGGWLDDDYSHKQDLWPTNGSNLNLFGWVGHPSHPRPFFRGHGFGIYDLDWLETRFESKFEKIMEEYDEGVEEEGFYESEKYEEIVDHMEWLVEKHDLFLTRVEYKIEHLGEWIEDAEEKLEYYEMKLEEYQADEDISEKHLMRIERWLSYAQDKTTMKIEWLTKKQTMLSDDLPSYQEFNGELTMYLDQIVSDGMMTEVESTEELLGSAASVASLVQIPDSVQEIAELSALAAADSASASLQASASVPEPTTWMTLLVALGVSGLAFRRRAI